MKLAPKAWALSGYILALIALIIWSVSPIYAGSVDLNGDGTIDSSDLAVISAHYNQTPAGSVSYDLNSDHQINAHDLSIEAKFWKNKCVGKKCNYP